MTSDPDVPEELKIMLQPSYGATWSLPSPGEDLRVFDPKYPMAEIRGSVEIIPERLSPRCGFRIHRSQRPSIRHSTFTYEANIPNGDAADYSAPTRQPHIGDISTRNLLPYGLTVRVLIRI